MWEHNTQTHAFGNGLTLVIEPMADVKSAAFSMLVPAGCIYDPPDQCSAAAVLSDMITRGAGERDHKQLSAALDNLGVQRSESVGSTHLSLTGATLADNLPQVMQIYGDIVQRPHLPADEFEAARLGVEQSLRATEDEPRQKVMLELRRRCYNEPWGRPTEGTLEGVAALKPSTPREHFERCVRPNGTILGIAGNVDVDQTIALVAEVFQDWKQRPIPTVDEGPRGAQHDHIDHESVQTHIGIAYDSVPYRDPEYYAAWAAVSVLSGGMSSRLFTEVRERRGLCYAVSASLNSLRDEARVLCYAGTTSEKAQQTLDVTLEELAKIGEGIEESELARCQARAKSSLIMQQESTFARSSSIARDWFHRGCVTPLDEIRKKIEGLTVETVLDYVHRHPAEEFTVLTIGPAPLEVHRAVS